MYKVGVVGAMSLLGKELVEELESSLLGQGQIRLLEEEDNLAGHLTSVGEEAAVVQSLDAEAVTGLDFVFFAGRPDAARNYARSARTGGASVVDLTGALEGEPGVPVRAPAVTEVLGEAAQKPGLETAAVVAAHPAAVMLGLVGARLAKSLGATRLSVALFEPASQHGNAAMDELHEQTVQLLSFKETPRTQYDTQVVFNLLPTLGEEAQIDLSAVERMIARQYRLLSPALPELDLELVQAPVFHSYVASVLVEFNTLCGVSDVEKALAGDGVDVVSGEGDPPSNLSAAGQKEVLVRVRMTSGSPESSTRARLWLAADNTKINAFNAIRCADELRRLRPTGAVQ